MSAANGNYEGTGLEIAVIGMAGRFPGAKNLAEFWANLRDGVESVTFFTDEELRDAGIGPELLEHPQYVKAKAMLEDVESFDAPFFNYTPREAELVDPQFRLFHECSWEALEDAGHTPDTDGKLIGVYAGASPNTYWVANQIMSAPHASDHFQILQLNNPSFTTRISYKLNLKGPSVSVQTACSTSLVSIHLACQGLLGGECDLALAGGVSINLPRITGYLYQEGMIQSPDGHCRPFDEGANGTLFGDGIGIVVLKRLADALADGDTIHAIIKGSAINNDGSRKVGYTAPSTNGQVEVIRAAHHMAEVHPESIGYIEAHGTGTALGDPIEVEALQLAFATEKTGFCQIGSLKSNIGHLDAAAGVAGFIKAVLALKHKQIPPSLHVKNPNPKIDFARSPFTVNTKLTRWNRAGGPLRAGVSSFGIGGTNAHIILEEAPPAAAGSEGRDMKLLVLSAETEDGLERATRNLGEFLRDHPETSLADAAYTLHTGRKRFRFRRALVCSDVREAIACLDDPANGKVHTGESELDQARVIFLFPGQGSQYVNMGLDLYRKEPLFRAEMDRCCEIIAAAGGPDPRELLYLEEGRAASLSAADRINRTEAAQPALFAFEYALAKLLMSWGIQPHAMMGHSIGEYTAACLSGVLSLQDALELVTLRGKLMQSLPAGEMLSVSLSEESLSALLPPELALAAVNGPEQCVVSGPPAAIASFAAALSERQVAHRKLHTSHAFHSAMMEPILAPYADKVKQIALSAPTIPYISNVTGSWMTAEDAADPGYWTRHARGTVRFADGAAKLLQEKQAVFVEVGPGNALSSFVRKMQAQAKAGGGHEAHHLIRHPQEQAADDAYLLEKIGKLWIAGVRIDWTEYYASERRRRIALPTYPFERRRYSVDGMRLAAGGLRRAAAVREGVIPEDSIREGALPGAGSGREAAARGGATARPVSASSIEHMIADTVQRHFGFSDLGMNDNFFDIGASSLDISQLADKLAGTLGKDIPVVALYSYPTVRTLAAFLRDDGLHTPTEEAEAQNEERRRAIEEGLARTERMRSASLQERMPVEQGERRESGSSASGESGLDIAVIGMAARFPGADNLDEFWRNLRDGVESITFFTGEELLQEGVDPALVSHPSYVKAKGILNGIDQFDAAFFGYSPREAELMDPQLRLFHECAWEALESAGYNPDAYPGLIGVYAGATPNLEWVSRFAGGLGGTERFSAMLLNDREFFSTQLSYKLNLRGPSISMQTACSTSLVNIALAAQGLLAGSCDIALAGGATVSVPHKQGYLYEDGMILSPDGHCRAFDEQAAGTVFGDGVGVVILKRLRDAIADGDIIHAVIKGFGLNNDGMRKVGFTAPSTKGQAEVIRAAHLMAGVEPESITYVEAHGTGTNMGDPIEIEALKEAFHTEETGFCRIGSVKSNVGHLNSAAGAAGFIKTVLAMKARQIPPTLHFEQENPKIDFANSPFVVNTALTPWESGRYPLRSGVSSFGIGGTNAHVVLEEAPVLEPSSEGRADKLLLVSARTATALKEATTRLAKFLTERPDINLSDTAYTLQAGRKAFEWRAAFVCGTAQEAAAILASPEPDRIAMAETGTQARSVVLLFPGQGSQYVNMGRGLYRDEPDFREEIDRCLALIQPHLALDLKAVLYPDEAGRGTREDELMLRTDIAQPLLFMVEYALAKLLMRWGVRPEAMMGHSIGEYVAACLAGVFTLEEALQLVALRGRLMQGMPAGAMLSVALPEAELRGMLPDRLALAAVNSTSLCVVAGESDEIDEFARLLEGKGCACRRLHTSHAFHSHMMDPILPEFADRVRSIRLKEPEIPFISNVSGTWITPEEATDPEYWVGHLRSAVRFADGLDELLSNPRAVFIEAGPGNALSTFVRKHLAASRERVAVNLLRHPQEGDSDSAYLLHKVGRLWLAGIDIDWAGFYAHERRRRVELPTYPMERQRYWLDEAQQPLAAGRPTGPRSGGKNPNMADWFYYPSWERTVLQEGSDKPDEDGKHEWLIFADGCGIADELAALVRKEGHRAVLVEAGPAFAKRDDDTFTLSPGSAEQYAQLLEDLRARELMPDRVVHLWNVTAADEELPDGNGSGAEAESERRQQELGYYSLIFLAQALRKQKESADVRIAVVSTDMQEVTGLERLSPGKITLLGPSIVIQQEYSGMRCVSIDIDAPTGSGHHRRTAERIAAELSVPASDRLIAYRGLYRWVQQYKPLALRQADPPAAPFRERGIYLITGGLGGIGMLTAEYLARHFRGRLILTGRSSFPAREEYGHWLAEHGEAHPISRKIKRVQQLEALGAEVTYIQADLSDEAQMNRVFEYMDAAYGCVNGVVQAAGLPGAESFRAIENIGGGQSDEQFRAKVQGLQTLSKLLAGREADVCILFSSIASVLGGLGFSAYSAANLYMDAFARRQNRAGGTRWLCVNWDAWEFWEQHSSTIGESLVELAILPAEAPDLFRYVYNPCGSSQVIVSTGDLDMRIDQWIRHAGKKQEEPAGSGASLGRPNLTNPYVAPRNRIEKAIADVWTRFFRMDEVGIHDNFFDLGASSLDMIQLTGKLNESLGESIAVVDLFTYPSIHALAQRLTRNGQDEAEEAELEQQLIGSVAKGKKRQQQQKEKRRKGEVLQ
ncbi:type I polyketide synthase [Paenibacillus thiaminolyticus]|uniref:Type I polyketide synthase n=3 Tax=Paenibacillus thiaminolyticus TaxID=49283 RepID=A0AAP9J4P1_PANTH|nr:type I polyketide synthase [Paenibacillus thiaminolyticus]MCY9534538.1 type I polyketide synthase [Paenibacillus thiaminolyticus]MCY9604565.1 type I polyketide synthase [Paenibacillus thiaminolyticus]MCY9610576.1 type I polyketide synthase [Paenibacillus thiaminolyticus]MCY9614022.1 type I polyketide synthase [Paenibacillus thiaminolyticus]MCY9618559.1 type I polyketide synthase [Paenibacillus thiaminolyticus]